MFKRSISDKKGKGRATANANKEDVPDINEDVFDNLNAFNITDQDTPPPSLLPVQRTELMSPSSPLIQIVSMFLRNGVEQCCVQDGWILTIYEQQQLGLLVSETGC